jgi:hypothetical protein
VGDDELSDLAQHGFGKEEPWDIAAIAALFGTSNQLANVTACGQQTISTPWDDKP